MDAAAEWENVCSMFVYEGQLMDKHLHVTEENLMQLANMSQVKSLFLSSQRPIQSPPALRAQLNKFTGEAIQCWSFLLQCSMYFTAQEGASDQDKVAQFIKLLTGKAIQWATTIWEQNHRATLTYEQLS